MVYSIESNASYLKCKYMFFLHFDLRSDPDPWKKMLDPHSCDKPAEPSPSRKSYPGKYGEELDQEVTSSELDAVIKELKEGKAIGLDGISPSIVKSMTRPTRQYILTFINSCIRERRMPAELKNGRVKLLYKGEDKRVAKNYRD